MGCLDIRYVDYETSNFEINEIFQNDEKNIAIEDHISNLQSIFDENYERFLLTHISFLKKQLIDLSNEKGIGHEETIYLSQELDEFIIHYQKLKLVL